MGTEDKATARPWRVERHAGQILEPTGGVCSVVVARAAIDLDWGTYAGDGTPHATRDAALARLDTIVRAVNAHDALVAALNVALQAALLDCPNGADNGRILPLDKHGNVDFPAIAMQCRAALALARESDSTDDGLNHPDHGIATMPGEDMRGMDTDCPVCGHDTAEHYGQGPGEETPTPRACRGDGGEHCGCRHALRGEG